MSDWWPARGVRWGVQGKAAGVLVSLGVKRVEMLGIARVAQHFPCMLFIPSLSAPLLQNHI
jgi:hypothetical protein